MIARSGRNGGWDRAVPNLSEEGLLLAEISHRVANEVSAALAAMRLSKSRPAGDGTARMIDQAIARLEGFAAVLRVLNIAPTVTLNARCAIEELVCGLCCSREGAANSMLSLDLVDVVIDGVTGRRLLLIASELVHNVIRHALAGRRGMLSLVLRSGQGAVHLAVMDDGPGIQVDTVDPGLGMGSHLVAEIVRRGGGEIACESGPRGTTVKVMLPTHSEVAAD